MRVDRAGRFAGDHRADDIADGERLRTFGLGLALGGNGIGGFAGLRNHQRDRVRIDNRIAIAPFAGIVDFDGHTGKRLNHKLARQSGVPAGSAGDDVDLFCRAEFGFRDIHLIEKDVARGLGDSAQRRVADGARLLVNLFEHEVLETALFRLNGIPIHVLHFSSNRPAVEVSEFDSAGRHNSHIAIRQKEDVAGVMKNGGDVGRDEVLVVAESDDCWRAVARGDDLVGLIGRDYGECEYAGEVLHGLAHSVFQRRPMTIAGFTRIFLNQVRDDLGIGVGGELVAFLRELLLQAEVVLDDAVVDNDDLAGAVAMRMGVFLGGTAVRRPASVSDAISAFQRLVADGFFEVAQLAFGAADLKTVPVTADGDARRIVSAILQPAQAFNDDRNDALLANVTDNATHSRPLGIPKPISVGEGKVEFFDDGVREDLAGDTLNLGLSFLPRQP